MKKWYGKLILLLVSLFLVTVAATGQEGFDFGMDLGLGAQTFQTADGPVTYQSLSLDPDIAFGKIGIGLDLTLNYRFVAPDPGAGETQSSIEIRKEDWVPSGDISFLDLYLPKFKYVRWGFKGDPLYVKFGSIENGTLGNGFIMGRYANTLFLPDRRFFGISFDLDGKLFDFPYVGLETHAGNLAALDVVGARVFTRPLIWLDLPIIKNLEVGASYVTDRQPDYFLTNGTELDPISIIGADFFQPILSNPVVSLAGFGDLVFQPKATGGMLGAGGKLISFIPYTVQLRFMGQNFIPAYFGPDYDLRRETLYQVATSDTEIIPATVGWLGSSGFSILEDQISLSISLDGPFYTPETPTENPLDYPHLRADFNIEEGLLPGFFFDAYYDRTVIQTIGDVFDATENTLIGANVNYKTGPAVITLTYDIRYDPNEDPAVEGDEWVTTAGLKSSISLF